MSIYTPAVKRHRPTGYLAIALATGMALHASLSAQELPAQELGSTPTTTDKSTSLSTSRIIVKWTTDAAARQKSGMAGGAGARKATALTGMSLSHFQAVTADMEVLQTDQELAGAALDAAIQRLEADPDIEYASPDLRRHRHALTSDPMLMEQWYLLSAQPAATRTELAWDITQGSPATIVAVLDTGVRYEHPDLSPVSTGGKLLPGYDFVTNPAVANDGDGRDADASDPGDWVSTADLAQQGFSDCDTGNSSWHGTRVSGLIGALTNNAMGVAGTAWNTQVLPIRVLGKCGGFDSDIIAGMRWAAGLPVTGAPLNTTPAKVINLSLGGQGNCSAAYQATVNEVTARGVLIVASAGNEGGPVGTPANCTGVLGVAGIRHAGTKVGFSSLGPQIGISAPGGNCVNTGAGSECLFSIVVATNSGTTTPVVSTYTDRFNFNVGTSFSAPLVASAAALLSSVNATLTPAQSIALLKGTAAPFPTNSAVSACRVPTSAADLQTTECNCTVDTCGAGMLNTGAAVAAALGPFGVLSINGAVVSGGSITASASGSFAPSGRTISSYAWSVLNSTGTAPVIVSPMQSDTTVQIPGMSQFTLRLTLTDDSGAQDVKDVVLSTPVVTAPAVVTTAPRGGGGGGELGWEMLLWGVLFYFARLEMLREGRSRGRVRATHRRFALPLPRQR